MASPQIYRQRDQVLVSAMNVSLVFAGLCTEFVEMVVLYVGIILTILDCLYGKKENVYVTVIPFMVTGAFSAYSLHWLALTAFFKKCFSPGSSWSGGRKREYKNVILQISPVRCVTIYLLLHEIFAFD